MSKKFRSEIKAGFWLLVFTISIIVTMLTTSCTSVKEFQYKDNYKHLHSANAKEQAEINKQLNRNLTKEDNE